jgi:tetratricopeptide (TPR) repeat protein
MRRVSVFRPSVASGLLFALAAGVPLVVACREGRKPNAVAPDRKLSAALSQCAADPLPGALDACRAAVRLGLAESGIATPRTDAFAARIASAYESEGRYQEALALYRDAVRRFPQDADLHYRLGALLLARFDAAEEAYGPLVEAVRRRPRFREALLALGGVQLDMQRYQEALMTYRALVDLAPDSPAVLLGLGRALDGSGDHWGAVEVLERATGLAPGDSWTWTALGQAQLSSGRPGQAADALTKAVNLYPKPVQAYCLLSQALDALGRTADAREACRRAQDVPAAAVTAPCNCQK